MQYQTITLELLEQRPQLYERLRQERQVLATAERLALDLKARHEFWKDSCRQTNPNLDPIQTASMAGELALKELEDQLESADSREDTEPLSLDGAMAYLRRHSSNE